MDIWPALGSNRWFSTTPINVPVTIFFLGGMEEVTTNRGIQLNKIPLKRKITRDPSGVAKMYVQVRFELIYRSEISYLTVHLHEKAR